MKNEGLCRTCDNNLHCVLTQENGVLQCEEFLGNGALKHGKTSFRSRQNSLSISNESEELQD